MKRKTNSKRRSNSKQNESKRNIRDDYRLTDSGALSSADRADQRDRRDYAKSRHNDPAWYAQNAQLLTDYASFPYGVPIGTKSLLTHTNGAFDTTTSVPGAMVLEYVPTIGVANNETSPINIAARNIYSFVRHANSGHSNYESPDLMMYLVAMDSVYMFHAWCKRALGVVLDYSPVNRYYPGALLQGMGIDPNDLAAHIADFRGFVNKYAVQIGSMCVPNSMSYMARHSWMTEGLYTDSMAAKAQTYLYNPVGYYQFAATLNDDDVVVSQLIRRYVPWTPNSPATVEQIINFGEELFSPIIANEDMNIMSGDILKAFGADGVVKISGVLDGYMVLPVYNQEVLMQMENATIFGFEYSGTSRNPVVTQNTAIGGGYLVSNERFYRSVPGLKSGASAPSNVFYSVYGSTINALINMHHDNVTPADTMVATRLTARVASASQATNGLQHPMATCGSEIVVSAKIIVMATNVSNGNAWEPSFVDVSSAMYAPLSATSAQVTAAEVVDIVSRAGLLSNFDWHPLIIQGVTYYANSTTNTMSFTSSHNGLLDIDNYTVLTSQNLDNLHLAALLSEFSVPQMGAFSNKL